MTPPTLKPGFATVATALLLAFGSPVRVDAQGTDTATYQVTFVGNWNTSSTPGGVVGGAHFTTLIGAVHNGNVTFWAPGGTATPGVEGVAELGATSTFKSEYNAVPAANRKALIEESGTGATGTSTFTIEATQSHPLVTLLSMIGPSPDWFVGVSGLSLRNSQGWQSRVSTNLFPYDAGTEDGTEFSLSNSATNPQGTIASLRGQGKFSNEPMATLTFDLQTAQPPPPDPEPPPDAEPLPDPEPTSPPTWIAPYWHGTGGFVARPADGRSAMVRLECGGLRHGNREYAGADGLIVRAIQRDACVGGDERPLQGELTFEGIEDGGWYWINGDRNVAVAPLVVEASLNSGLNPPVPGGVSASPMGDSRFVRSVTGRLYGTLMVHEGNGFMGIVPHLTDMEGDGEHVAPYWQGGGGIVGRPLDGVSTEVRLSCGGGETETHTLEPGEDGTIATLLPGGCFDSDGNTVGGDLEADGFEDGAWYWINSHVPVAAPLVRRGSQPAALSVPLVPDGVEAVEGPWGTLFTRGNLMGIVPRVQLAAP
ncbi:MAG: hypothetical protein F4112_07440 [Holophagales bacterium]|nr:hypothetical protein [Holophagales bacterium]MYD22152.1 hypothetical protein [Holophagales bacterium]MYI32785.1 hypothetical protein [Holophagales bacterium]